MLIKTTDAAALTKINGFTFVVSSSPVALAAGPVQQAPPISNKLEEEALQDVIVRNSPLGFNALNYGASYNQIHLHEGEYLHDKGFTGQDITIAVLDAGFLNYKTNNAFDSLKLQQRIIAEWDFVAGEASVTEDHYHGAYCLSIMACNKPGIVMGSAPSAKYLLLRTEDAATEYPIEEQNWVAAAEYADSAGADIITSSLGYTNFDNPIFNHSYAQRDGKTALISRGASMAVKKGMIVTNSAGNDGGYTTDFKYVACPADADSVFSIGATNVSGTIAAFSSWGPNGAGKQKPNVVSVGQGTVFANTAGNVAAGNGTSYSNPLLCGLIACLWQAFPEFKNSEILNAVQSSAHLFQTPDYRYGYGIPNFRKAYMLLAQERESRRIAAILGNNWFKAYPLPFNNNLNVLLKAPFAGKVQCVLMDATGKTLETKELTTTIGQIYFVNFNVVAKLPSGVYYIRYQDGTKKELIRIHK